MNGTLKVRFAWMNVNPSDFSGELLALSFGRDCKRPGNVHIS